MNAKTDFDPRFDPAFQPGFVAGSSGQAPPRREASVGLVSPAAAALQAAPDERGIAVTTTVTTPARNPFVIGLTAVGLALVGAGIAVIRSLGAAFTSVDIKANLDYYTLDVLMTLGPLLITLGMATLIGVGFLAAVRWKSTR